ncbi:MAG TPA: DNA repair protein RecO [Candidatus Saccharimonadales bacterium]|nr:DNA repair protein RecO [Candidatus Saccharimonadales bacterium]
MSVERTTGLVLRTRPLTESSLIVHWLTSDLGRLATVAKGARRNKSPFRGQIDLFYLAEISFSRSRRSDLHALREVRLLESHAALRTELSYLQQASYCAALIEETTETDTPLPKVYDQFIALLRELPRQPARAATIFAFEMKLLNELGLQPNLAETPLSAGAKQLLEKLTGLDWPAIGRLRLSAAQETELRQYLHGYLIYHLDKLPRGRNAALGG